MLQINTGEIIGGRKTVKKELLGIRLYDVIEIIEMTGIRKLSVLKYFRSGRLKGSKLQGKWYSTKENIIEMMTEGNQRDLVKKDEGSNEC